MSNKVNDKVKAARAALVAALGDESGAARQDRVFLIGAGAVLGAIVLFSWLVKEPPSETVAASGPAAAQAQVRTITSSRTLAPEPPPRTEEGTPRGYVSADLPAFQIAPPDTEGALLDAMTERARADDAAAFAAGAFGDAPRTGAEAPAGSEDTTVSEAGSAPDGT